MLILHDSDTLRHRTIELLGAKVIPALESPERITSILEALQSSPHAIRLPSLDCDGEEKFKRVAAILKSHDPGYIEHLRTAHDAWVAAGLVTKEESVLPECFHFKSRAEAHDHPPIKPKDIYALAGYYAFDMSTGIMEETFRSALASAHLAFCGVEILGQIARNTNDIPHAQEASRKALMGDKRTELDENSDSVLALCRPPGHHCDTKRAGGYCYMNNAVVAVERWLNSHPGQRVGILDIDFHHGNGTQDYFYDRSDVMYVSIHGQDEYPYYTGTEDETGIGEGKGYNLNLPLLPKSSVEEYLEKLSTGLAQLQTFNSHFLIVSLGFDTYRLDPLGGFDIDTEDYTTIGSQIRETLKDMAVLILLEGGYVLDDLGKNILAFLEGWEAAK